MTGKIGQRERREREGREEGTGPGSCAEDEGSESKRDDAPFLSQSDHDGRRVPC